jgi:hypothetical protein
VAALAGVVGGVVFRKAAAIALGLWIVLAALLLVQHAPVWLHHSLLMVVPAAGLGGLALGFAARLAMTVKGKRLLMLATASGLLLSVEVGAARTSHRRTVRQVWNMRDQGRDAAVEEAIRQHAPDARKIVTTRQIHAFRMGLEVPPWLAVTSAKRFKSGLLSVDDVIAVIREEKPDAVVLDDRWLPWDAKRIPKALRGRYRRVYADEENRDVRVYVRRAPRRSQKSP